MSQPDPGRSAAVPRGTPDRSEAPLPLAPPVAPAGGAVLFGDRLPVAEAYAGLLATVGTERGLLGPREVGRLWDRHLLNCAVVTELLPQGATVVDVGSGAGLPGLVLAIRRPDLQVTLLEPLLRRATFLLEVVDVLGLEGVEVVRTRAEELHGRRSFQVVASRAVAPLERLLGWCLPLVAADGAVVAMKGASAAAEVAALGGLLGELGGTNAEVLQVGTEETAVTTVVRVGADPGRRLPWGPPGAQRAASASGRKRRRR